MQRKVRQMAKTTKSSRKPTPSTTASKSDPVVKQGGSLRIDFHGDKFTVKYEGFLLPGDVLLALERAKIEVLGWSYASGDESEEFPSPIF
jgi:hypothetical protein